MESTKKSLSDKLHNLFSSVAGIRFKGGVSDGRALDELADEIADTKKQLASPSMIKATAEKLKDAQAKSVIIDRLIGDKTAEVNALCKSFSSLLQFDGPRGDLLAEIALGNASESDLASFDEKCKPELGKADKEWAKRDKMADTVGQSIEGLNRKAVTIRTEIDSLSTELHEFSLQAVIGLALEKGARYTKLAVEAAQLYRELHTLHETAKEAGMGKDFSGIFGLISRGNVLIPALNLPPFSGEFANNSWAIIDSSLMRAHRRPIGAPVVELESLRESGAVIPTLLPFQVEKE